MENNKGIFIAESMASTKLVSLLRTVEISKNMQNGEVLGLGELVGGDSELYAQADAAEGNVYLVDAVELMAEEGNMVGLDNFSLKKGDIARVRKPMSGDRFSVSKTVISGDVAAGSTMSAEGKALTVGEDGEFKIIEEWIFGKRAIDMVRVEVL